MNSIYIIGDIHGCFTTLIRLIDRLPKNSKIAFVGDMVDRGLQSKEVVEFIKNNSTIRRVFLWRFRGFRKDKRFNLNPKE